MRGPVLVAGQVVVAALAVTACQPCEGARVRIVGAGGDTRLDVCAEVATSEVDRRAGLAGRPGLDDGAGLLMIFPVVGEVCITGENMRFPLDVVFVDGSSHVTARGALGVDDPALICEPEIAQVLEVSAGIAGDVEVGDALNVE